MREGERLTPRPYALHPRLQFQRKEPASLGVSIVDRDVLQILTEREDRRGAEVERLEVLCSAAIELKSEDAVICCEKKDVTAVSVKGEASDGNVAFKDDATRAAFRGTKIGRHF